MTESVRDIWVAMVEGLQDNICAAVEACDEKETFVEDVWTRKEGGGGKTRIISKGKVFEKGGVNTSVVFGDVTEAMEKQLNIYGATWFASGISLVLHPENPFIPTVHCNYRMFELYDAGGKVTDRWFGGGTDLTPYYLFEEDARHFHGVYKSICDNFDPGCYAVFKKQCDDYFVNRHRDDERRGIGGIFYDYQRPDEKHSLESWINFGKVCGEGFTEAYLPIAEKRKKMYYQESHRHWQEIRRGRYTEFNLVHDRGTVFGLKTNGRTESILMSLPPTVRFEYNFQPAPGSEEEKLLQACLHPVDWV